MEPLIGSSSVRYRGILWRNRCECLWGLHKDSCENGHENVTPVTVFSPTTPALLLQTSYTLSFQQMRPANRHVIR